MVQEFYWNFLVNLTFFICVCVFISDLLNDSILNFGYCLKELFSPPTTLQLLQGTWPGAQHGGLYRPFKCDSFTKTRFVFCRLFTRFCIYILFVLSYTGRFDCLISFTCKVWVLCRGSTAGKRLRRFFARISFALLVLWKQRGICIKQFLNKTVFSFSTLKKMSFAPE